jgi:hypothetical protein
MATSKAAPPQPTEWTNETRVEFALAYFLRYGEDLALTQQSTNGGASKSVDWKPIVLQRLSQWATELGATKLEIFPWHHLYATGGLGGISGLNRRVHEEIYARRVAPTRANPLPAGFGETERYIALKTEPKAVDVEVLPPDMDFGKAPLDVVPTGRVRNIADDRDTQIELLAQEFEKLESKYKQLAADLNVANDTIDGLLTEKASHRELAPPPPLHIEVPRKFPEELAEKIEMLRKFPDLLLVFKTNPAFGFFESLISELIAATAVVEPEPEVRRDEFTEGVNLTALSVDNLPMGTIPNERLFEAVTATIIEPEPEPVPTVRAKRAENHIIRNTPGLADKVLDLYNLNWGPTEIARKLGLSRGSVRHYLNRVLS